MPSPDWLVGVFLAVEKESKTDVNGKGPKQLGGGRPGGRMAGSHTACSAFL